MKKEAIQTIANLILNHSHIVFLTGSGMSTGSGIPDYRGKTSIYWKKYEPYEYNYQNFLRNEYARIQYWKMSADFYEMIQKALPSPAHEALAKLETLGKCEAIITQNVDGLHQKAGSLSDCVLEVHGTIHQIICLDCSTIYLSKDIYANLHKGIPYCYYCGGILKPSVIDFGQPLPQVAMAKALKRTLDSDLFIVVGSSLTIQPAATLPIIAKENKKTMVIINDTPTACDSYADYLLQGECSAILMEIVRIIQSHHSISSGLRAA